MDTTYKGWMIAFPTAADSRFRASKPGLAGLYAPSLAALKKRIDKVAGETPRTFGQKAIYDGSGPQREVRVTGYQKPGRSRFDHGGFTLAPPAWYGELTEANNLAHATPENRRRFEEIAELEKQEAELQKESRAIRDAITRYTEAELLGEGEATRG